MTDNDTRMTDEVNKRMDEVKASAMRKHFAAVKSIYLDLVLLKDLRLGWLLANCNEAERAYVIKHITDYNSDALHRDQFTYAFPELASKEAYLQQHYTEHLEDALDYAPDTTIFINLNDILIQHYRQNYRTGYENRITVWVNTYPVAPCPLLTEYERVLQLAFHDHADFKFICQEPLTIPSKTWDAYSCIYIHDIDKMCSYDKTPWLECVSDGSWITKQVYGAPVFAPEVVAAHQSDDDDDDPRWVHDVLENTAVVLQTCCQFRFIDPSIPVLKENADE